MGLKKIASSALSLLVSGFLLFFVEGIMPVGDTKWLILAGIGILMLIIINRKELIETIFRRKSGKPEETGPPENKSVDYMGAWEIIDAYLQPALVDKRDGVRLVIRKDMMDKFDNVTGAKLGEYQYNRVLLRQWLESNAARLLVEHRGELS